MKRTILAGVLLAACNAQAWDVYLPLASKHFDTDKKYNEFNPGIGIGHEFDEEVEGKPYKHGPYAITYVDSHKEQAYNVGWRLTRYFGNPQGWNYSFGGAIFVARRNGEPAAGLVPTASIGYGRIRLEASAFPSPPTAIFWLRGSF